MHRLINELVIRSMKPRMLCRVHPFPHDLVELFNRHARVRGRDYSEKSLLPGPAELREVVVEHGLERLLIFPFRVLAGISRMRSNANII